MPISDAQKRASAKWDAQHMTTVSVRMCKDTAEQLTAAAKANGTTRNAVLLAAAREYIRTHSTAPDTTQDT